MPWQQQRHGHWWWHSTDIMMWHAVWMMMHKPHDKRHITCKVGKFERKCGQWKQWYVVLQFPHEQHGSTNHRLHLKTSQAEHFAHQPISHCCNQGMSIVSTCGTVISHCRVSKSMYSVWSKVSNRVAKNGESWNDTWIKMAILTLTRDFCVTLDFSFFIQSHIYPIAQIKYHHLLFIFGSKRQLLQTVKKIKQNYITKRRYHIKSDK